MIRNNTSNRQAIQNLIEDLQENLQLLEIMVTKEEQKSAAPARRSANVTLFSDSSFIQSVSYESKTSDLTVQMKNGNSYVYLGVPEFVYVDFINAKSGGVYFNSHVKNQYAVRSFRD